MRKFDVWIMLKGDTYYSCVGFFRARSEGGAIAQFMRDARCFPTLTHVYAEPS